MESNVDLIRAQIKSDHLTRREREFPFRSNWCTFDDGALIFEDKRVPPSALYIPQGSIAFASELLYHYTSRESFESIAESGAFWISEHSSMNDPREVQYASDLLEYRIRWLCNGDKNLVTEAIDQASQDIAAPTLIGSFSRHGDSLSQWREYGGRNGVVLGLPRDVLASCESVIGGRLVDVIYEPELQNAMIDPFAKAMIAAAKGEKLEGQAGIAANFAELAYSLKQPGYFYEAEVRVVAPIEEAVCKTRNSVLSGAIRYRELDIAECFGKTPEVDIAFDTIGAAPCEDRREAVERTAKFLGDRGIKFRQIVSSQHSFRW